MQITTWNWLHPCCFGIYWYAITSWLNALKIYIWHVIGMFWVHNYIQNMNTCNFIECNYLPNLYKYFQQYTKKACWITFLFVSTAGSGLHKPMVLELSVCGGGARQRQNLNNVGRVEEGSCQGSWQNLEGRGVTVVSTTWGQQQERHSDVWALLGVNVELRVWKASSPIFLLFWRLASVLWAQKFKEHPKRVTNRWELIWTLDPTEKICRYQ
jgi:hypothetical protein